MFGVCLKTLLSCLEDIQPNNGISRSPSPRRTWWQLCLLDAQRGPQSSNHASLRSPQNPISDSFKTQRNSFCSLLHAFFSFTSERLLQVLHEPIGHTGAAKLRRDGDGRDVAMPAGQKSEEFQNNSKTTLIWFFWKQKFIQVSWGQFPRLFQWCSQRCCHQPLPPSFLSSWHSTILYSF